MKTLAWTKSTKYEICILCSQPKSKNTCIFPRKNACFLLFGWPQKMHTSLICRNRGMYFTKKVKICIASWENAYFWKILEPSKMHIEKCVLPKNADWKCIFFACYFYGHSKMHNGFWHANFPDLHGLPKSPVVIFLYLFFSVPFERHSTSLARDSSTHFGVSTWARCSIFWKIKRKWISMVSVVSRLRGFWLGSCDQLWAETTRYGRGAGCDCKFRGHLHPSLNTYSIYHAMLESKQSECIFLRKTLQINFVTCISGILWLRSWRVFTVAQRHLE